MSCNGCRVLRKGCNDNCILRQSLQCIDSPQAQSYATVFVAKFFGRAGLISFLSNVPESQRPDLFQSLLFEACGRTVNPVNGAVGLLWTGNWHVCQSAVETILRGGVLREMPELIVGAPPPDLEDALEANDGGMYRSSQDLSLQRSKTCDTKNFDNVARLQPSDLDLGLTSCLQPRITAGGKVDRRMETRRAVTPSMNSEESETTTLESGSAYHPTLQKQGETKLLRLFF